MVAARPKLIVFDLDFTLWDCGGTWCDCLTPPFRMRAGNILDRRDHHIRLYPDVPEILDHCDRCGIPMALASRTEQPDWARELIDMLEIGHRFVFQEIYPTAKPKHFSALQADSGCSYFEMLFFDDEPRNTRDVSELGVTCIDVPSGISWSLFQASLEHFGR